MKKSVFSVSILTFLVLAGCQPSGSVTPPVTTSVPARPPAPAPQPAADEEADKKNAKLFFVTLAGTPGQTGETIGCGDSLNGVPTDVSDVKTDTAAEAALTKLLSLKEQNLDKEGQYNALYQSDLKVESLTVDNDKNVTVKLSGTTQLGGVCDTPRFEEQLKATVLQFEDKYSSVEFFINNEPMEKVLSLK